MDAPPNSPPWIPEVLIHCLFGATRCLFTAFHCLFVAYLFYSLLIHCLVIAYSLLIRILVSQKGFHDRLYNHLQGVASVSRGNFTFEELEISISPFLVKRYLE